LSCPICETRKERRFCPAVHGRICAVCCGEQREVTLDCPGDCPYLQQARQREKRDINEVPQEDLFPQVEVRERFLFEREPLIVGLTYGLVKAARADRRIADRDAIAAVTALARSYQTLVNSGLVVGDATPNVAQQAITAELEKMVAEYRQVEQQHLGAATLKNSEVLEALVFVARMGQAQTSGRPLSRAFLDFLFARFPQKDAAVVPAAGGEDRRIIL
jgi:hypothetical protein